MKINSSAMVFPALLSTGLLAQPTVNFVQAAKAYQIQVIKTVNVYTAKGKKTKTVYKKNKVLTAYRVKKIKGKYYYDLGHGKYIQNSYAKKYTIKKTNQTKKLIRTIKLYGPTGLQTIKQNAYVKRTVATNLITKKKSYSKWTSSSWKSYIAPTVAGYTASPSTVNSEKVYSWTKSKKVKVAYKKTTSDSQTSNTETTTTFKPFIVHLYSKSMNQEGVQLFLLTVYTKNGNTFSEKEDLTIEPPFEDNITYTALDQASDEKGNVYYYVQSSKGDKYWILASATDKPVNSSTN